MKKYFLISALSMICANAFAAVPWWQQPTICRFDPTNCYPTMGAGFDKGLWDTDSKCWGLKMVCPAALSANPSDPMAISRRDIERGIGIKRDFDTAVLNGDCFGARKTTANGTMASVNGKFVNVWCAGVLDNADEELPNGEITFGAQPTCETLARDGYVAVVNNRCFGKYFDDTEYYIECDGGATTPNRLIILNGADPSSAQGATPADKSAADAMFNKMLGTSQKQHKKYFK